MVIGQGLWLVAQLDETTTIEDRASMGYIYNRIKKVFGIRQNLTVCFDTCYSAEVYKRTIRGELPFTTADNIEDCDEVPEIPLYGPGDGFTHIPVIMYLQEKHRFKNWWVDLRTYDKRGLNKKLKTPEKRDEKGFTETSITEYAYYKFFTYCID